MSSWVRGIAFEQECGARFSLQRRHSCRRGSSKLAARAAARVPLRHAKACATLAPPLRFTQRLTQQRLAEEGFTQQGSAQPPSLES